MNALLLDTNVVSILFGKAHPLRPACLAVLAGHELAISFMSRAELLLWPSVNQWGEARRTLLLQHLDLYTTLLPDERTCDIWVEVVSGCRSLGRPIQTADAWIASIARQWNLPLVTTDVHDFDPVEELRLIPIR